MGKAILAMIVTVIVGFMSSAIFANWVNAPEWGIVLLQLQLWVDLSSTSTIRRSNQISVCRSKNSTE